MSLRSEDRFQDFERNDQPDQSSAGCAKFTVSHLPQDIYE